VRLATRVFRGPLQLMAAVAFTAGTLIVAAVAHTVISSAATSACSRRSVPALLDRTAS
jgi:hypothetical protein